MIDFAKKDTRRSPEINQKIIQWFEYLINTPNIYSTLQFYISQNALLYIKERDGLLRFYGCENHIDHHSSNIEYIIKYICHKILHDNAKKEVLLDYHTFALAQFGLLRAIYVSKNGNGDTLVHTDVKGHKIMLCKRQINILRNILRMIKGKDSEFELNQFKTPFNSSGKTVDELEKLSYQNKLEWINLRDLNHHYRDYFWYNEKLSQWFKAEKVLYPSNN